VTTEERVENLERQLRNLKAELEERVKTRAVEVVDEQGRGRVVLDVTGDGAPVLVLYDVNNKPRIKLIVTGDGPGLTLTDENGRDRVELDVTGDRTGLRLYAENGRGRVELDVTGDGSGLRMYDVNNKRILLAP
jgi:hypothetical protein